MEINYDKLETKEFNDYFLKNIGPKLKQAEKIRQTDLANFKSALTISVSIYFVFILVYIFGLIPEYSLEKFGAGPNSLLVFIIPLVIASIWPFMIVKNYQKEMKKMLFPVLFKSIGNFKFSNNTLKSYEIEQYNLFEHFNQYSSDDTITGTYKNINLGIYEVDLKKREQKSEEKTEVKRVFKGLICKFHMNKEFSGKTIVLQDKGWFTSVPGYDNRLKKVHLEDPVFENHFEVYSRSQIESRYLLTTAFMQRLLDLKHKFNSNISCCFYNQEIIVAIPCKTHSNSSFDFKNFEFDVPLLGPISLGDKNFFELPWLFENMVNIQHFKKILIEFISVVSIVDTLKLEQDIGM